MLTEQPATVRYAGTTLILHDSIPMIVGRGAATELQVGRSPVDPRVSRQHVSLTLEGRLVTVTRLSRTQLVLVRTASGTLSLDSPGESIRRGGSFSVLLPRTPSGDESTPEHYRLDVVAPDRGGPATTDVDETHGAEATAARPELGERDRLLLAAYARPLLLGGTATATHNQVAKYLNYGYDWCRERVDRLRIRLAADGWSVGTDKESLCRWAVAMHIITADDLPEEWHSDPSL
jgi:hypothetical protein